MITVNDREEPHREGQTIEALLADLDPRLPMAVVKINGKHVPRREWKNRTLRDGDDVRVVYIIAGG